MGQDQTVRNHDFFRVRIRVCEAIVQNPNILIFAARKRKRIKTKTYENWEILVSLTKALVSERPCTFQIL